MAGEWIKIERSTLDKPEVIRVARKLGVDKDLVIGKLIRLWGWFDANSSDGVVDGVVDADVDGLVGIDGFCSALKGVKWFGSDYETEKAWLPNFDRHNGETAKKRAEKSRRQSKWRQNRAANVDTSASTSTSTREEKRREEKKPPCSPPQKTKKKSPPAPDDLPENVSTSLWTDFVNHRKAIKKPMTAEAAKRLAAKLGRMTDQGHDAALALENSIVNGWQGVFEPDKAANHVPNCSRSGSQSAVDRNRAGAERYLRQHYGTVG